MSGLVCVSDKTNTIVAGSSRRERERERITNQAGHPILPRLLTPPIIIHYLSHECQIIATEPAPWLHYGGHLVYTPCQVVYTSRHIRFN